MKKITLLSLVAITVLFTACTEETKKAATDAASAATETVTETSTNALDAAKAKTAEIAEAAKVEAEKMAVAAAEKAAEVKAAAEAKASEVAEAVKESATATTEAITEAVTLENTAGKEAYAKCAGCHGADGTSKALGKAAPVAGQTAEALAEALRGYKAGTRNEAGMGTLMKGQVASMDEATITAVAEYMAGL